VAIRLVGRAEGGTWLALPEVAEPFTTLLSRVGRVPLPGYIRGGVTVFGAKRDYPVVVDSTMRAHSVVSVSAGQRGLQIFLAPADYLRASKAKEAPIGRPVGGTAEEFNRGLLAERALGAQHGHTLG
jgi:hypothetical protein